MIIGRKAELEWLQRQSGLSRLILINGVRGVGKSKLIREWLKQNQTNFTWITVERFKSLSQILNRSGSMESALEEAAKSWQNFDLVIWDEVHLLAPNIRQFIFSFLRNSPYLPLQIFLSDEDLEIQSLDLELAQLKLNPFQTNEIEQYLTEASGNKPSAEDLETAIKTTGGLPLLLHLWLQNRDHDGSLQNRIFEKLSKEEIETLQLAATLGRSFQPNEISANEVHIASLKNKYLLEKIPGNQKLFNVPSYVRSLCIQSQDLELKKFLSEKIFSLLQKNENANSLELLLQSIRSQNANLIEQAISPKIVEQLEQLNRNDLQEFSTLLKQIDFDKQNSRITLVHLLVRALFLLGDRAEALTLAENESKKINLDKKLSKNEQALFQEYIQLLNRAGKAEDVRNLSSKAIFNVDETCSIFLKIEQATSWLSSDSTRAKQILEQLIKTDISSSLARAQAEFQYARILDISGITATTDEHYALALQEFRKADRPYFAAVTLLNRAWLSLNQRNWDLLTEIRSELAPLAERFGYNYVLAGLDIIDAIRARLFLQYSLALQKSESALKRLGNSAPLLARFDAQSEYIRSLMSLGLRQQAEIILKKIRSDVQSNETLLKGRFDQLHLEVQSTTLSNNDLLDKMDKENELNDSHILIQLQRGINIQKDNLRAYPQGKLAIHEQNLIKALEKNAETEIWQTIAKMERLLEQSADPIPEKIALNLLQASLTKSKDQKSSLIQKAELTLQRCGADAQVRQPLEAWLENLNTDGKSKIFEQTIWQKSSTGDKERWLHWFRFSQQDESLPWLVITENERKESDEQPKPSANADLYMVEHLAEVYWKGKAIPELIRKHALRKLLSLLLEHSAEGAEKETIASVVWGETYRPDIHDARIYTSIQRLRILFKTNSCIQSWNGGYRWNPQFKFQLLRYQVKQKVAASNNRCQNLILQALERFAQSGKNSIARTELVSITKSSEATVKRELAKLLTSAKILRMGKGRAVSYCLKNNSGVMA